MTYFCALGIFSVKVLKYTSIKSQHLKYTNDIREMEEIFFFKTYRETEVQETQVPDQSLTADKGE